MMKNLTGFDLLMPGLNKMAAEIKAMERARDEQIRCNTNHMLRIEELVEMVKTLEQRIEELRERVEEMENSPSTDYLDVERKNMDERLHKTEKRLDELERKIENFPLFGTAKITLGEPAPPPERSGLHRQDCQCEECCIDIKEEPDTPPECLCDARKREEEK